MDTLDDFKNDIKNNELVVEQQKEIIKKEIENGLFDDEENVFMTTPNYFNNTVFEMNAVREEKQTTWQRIKQNIKKFFLS